MELNNLKLKKKRLSLIKVLKILTHRNYHILKKNVFV